MLIRRAKYVNIWRLAFQPFVTNTRKNPVRKDFRAEVSRITGWVGRIDYPDRADLTGGNLDLPDDVVSTISNLKSGALGTTQIGGPTKKQLSAGVNSVQDAVTYHWGIAVADDIAVRGTKLGPYYGNKLGGWPSWADAPQWKTNEGKHMVPFFQFDAANGMGLGYPVSLRCNLFVDANDPKIMKMTAWRNG